MARVSPQVTARPLRGKEQTVGQWGLCWFVSPLRQHGPTPSPVLDVPWVLVARGTGVAPPGAGCCAPMGAQGLLARWLCHGNGRAVGWEQDLETNTGLWEPPRPVARQLVGPGVRYSLLREAAWGLGVCVCVCVYRGETRVFY